MHLQAHPTVAKPLYVNALKFSSRRKWAYGRMGVAGHGLFAAAAFYYMHNSAKGSSLVRLGPLAPPSM